MMIYCIRVNMYITYIELNYLFKLEVDSLKNH
jgi:hypothetical protein